MSDTCPYCPPATAWGGSPEMFEKLRSWHDAGHPNADKQVTDLVASDLAHKLHLSNPPKQAGTTPTTDQQLEKILDDTYAMGRSDHLLKADDYKTLRLSMLKKLTEVITQERNKAIQKELIRHIANLSYAAGWMNDHPYIAKELELAQARLEEEKE